jgi:hypothetical protein
MFSQLVLSVVMPHYTACKYPDQGEDVRNVSLLSVGFEINPSGYADDGV